MTTKPQRALESALLWGTRYVSVGLLALSFFVALASTSCASHRGQTLAPAQPESSSKLVLEGVPNFGRVTETLYRGGQPTEKGFEELRSLGIEIVVNFRDEPAEITTERRALEHLGLRYVSLPWNSWHRPQSRLVADFLELVRANAGRKIFVHCHHGADRTGVMVALFRIASENWTPEQAIGEMQVFHFHRFLFPHLKSYVRNFPQMLSTDPSFRLLVTPTGTVDISVETTTSGSSNTGTLFRYVPTANQYMYNLSTAGYSTGTYLAVVTLNDGTSHQVSFSVK